MSETPILQVKGVSKHFGAVQALTKVDFEVREGEVMALVGDNGAGKSTLIKGIAGIYSFDEGSIHFEGQPVHIHNPKDSAALGIEVVYQDLALADNLDVALLPVWGWGPTLGTGHMNPYRAAEALQLLQPRLAIPIHWGTFFPFGLGRIMPRLLIDPPHLFALAAAKLAPEVETQIIPPGQSISIEGEAND